MMLPFIGERYLEIKIWVLLGLSVHSIIWTFYDDTVSEYYRVFTGKSEPTEGYKSAHEWYLSSVYLTLSVKLFGVTAYMRGGLT